MHQDCENLIESNNLTKQEQDDILELVEMGDFFSDFLKRNYIHEEKCHPFTWDCTACRAWLLKEALESFIEDHIDVMENIK